MSSDTKPLGMNSMPSSGYNHKSTTYNKQYVTWKGSGVNSNPAGSASGHIRPLTNNDSGNVFPTGFGLPRPIKHFRKGRVIRSEPITGNSNNIALINYNLNRFVKSSKGTSLGGGNGLLNDLQDKPGAVTVKENSQYQVDNTSQMDNDCKICEGVGVVVDYYPNQGYLTQNPNSTTTNSNTPNSSSTFCCNEEYKAKRRSIYASTNLKKNYYTTTKQYLQNRCKTYEQKSFNFLSERTNDTVRVTGPTAGSPETQTTAFMDNNYYLANCQPETQLYDKENNAIISGPLNPTGCQLTVYKPNNYQYAQQGAVSSSTRNLKLNVSTISTNSASINNYNNTGPQLVSANQLYAGDDPVTKNLLKNKAPGCNTPWPLNFSQSGAFQNKRFCKYKLHP
jgi:hypothetical protein